MNFATLKGLTIPEGVVTQIADASGRVLWKLETSKPVVLKVEKITSDTYAGETTYTGEQFILLDIYPKTNGTVKVTYGGLTKTITDTSGVEEPNAQKVFFGTFNGVSDSVATPASGELTIEGSFYAFGSSAFTISSKGAGYYSGITEIIEFGDITSIVDHAFYNCSSLVLSSLPDQLTSIGTWAFYGIDSISIGELPTNLQFIGDKALYTGEETAYEKTRLSYATIPSGMTYIGDFASYNNAAIEVFDTTALPNLTGIGESAFSSCANLKKVVIGDNITDIEKETFYNCDRLIDVTIGKNVSHIANGAFAFPTGDKTFHRKITVLATTPPTITNSNALGGVGTTYGNSTYEIVVPVGCGAAYKAANVWSVYADYITEAS